MSEFQKYLGGTATYTKRVEMATKGCGQLTSNYTYFADSWLSSVKTAEQAMATGVEYCGMLKTIDKGFSRYVIKLNERLARRVISCYEEN